MSISKNPERFALSKSQNIDETKMSPGKPESKVTGNESIKILKHSLNYKAGDSRGITYRAEISIQNISDTTIANIIFEALFYDAEGNVLDIVKHNEIELKPNTSRAVAIIYSKEGINQPTSYHIRISKMMKSDVEKVQLRQHEIRTNEAGEEEITAIVKNISNVKTDAALVANFFNSKKEKIGSKVIIVRDIEPDNNRQFRFLFKPQEGDIVRTYNLNIVCDIEEC